MARKTKKFKKKSKAKTVAKRVPKKTNRASSRVETVDSVNKTMKHAVAQTLVTAVDHMPYDLGYSFK